MLVIGFPAAVFATNCYVVAPAAGEECLIIDPGIGVLDQLSEVLEQNRLKPAAVLATHGHLDHVFSVTPVCGAHSVAVHVHGEDRYRVADPIASLGVELRGMLEAQFGPSSTQWSEPDDVQVLTDRQQLQVAGLSLEVLHAPGHTEGSVMFSFGEVPDQVRGASGEMTGTIFSGDVLFAGSIGRTDLPGGSHAAMLASLRDVVLPLADGTVLLPGHGPATTMGRERATNPYLAEVMEGTR